MKNHHLKLHGLTAVALILSLLLGYTLAHADVTVVRKLRLESPAYTGAVRARSAYQLKGGQSRRETETTVTGTIANRFHYPVKTITLLSLADNNAHLYNSRSLGFDRVPISKLRKHLAKEDDARGNPFHITQSWSRVIPETATRKVKGNVCN